jgi:hypothetical protein
VAIYAVTAEPVSDAALLTQSVLLTKTSHLFRAETPLQRETVLFPGMEATDLYQL